MAVNEFLTFAGDPAANVMPQGDYAASGFTTRLLGFSTGTALSVQLNKVWRQSSLISNMIGQFTVDNTSLDMLDDGTATGMTALQTHFTAAITTVARGAVGLGYLPLIGGTLTGPLVINAAANQLSINATLAQPAQVILSRDAAQNALIQANSAGVPRWTVYLATNTPETGNNSGSDFAINRFADNGTFIATPLSINRATGVVNFGQMPTLAGGSLPFLPLVGGTLTGNLNIRAGGTGITYPQISNHTHAFGWDGNVHAYVDNNWVGQIAMAGWVNSLVGGYLPLGGGTITGNLQVNGSLVVNGGSGFRSSVWFANLSDFINFYDGRFRFRQWAGSWYDAWDGQTGNRVWAVPNAWVMTLNSAGTLWCAGYITAQSGRITSIAGGTPSVCGWDQGAGIAAGFWVNGNGLMFGGMDGGGNPTVEWGKFQSDGYFVVWNGQHVNGSLYATGNITAGNQLVSNNGIRINGGLMEAYGGRFMVHGSGPTMGLEHPGIAMVMSLQQFGLYGLQWSQSDYNGNPFGLAMALNPNGTLAAGALISISTETAKQNVRTSKPLDSLAAIRRIDTYSFDYMEKHTDYGFVAENVQKALADAVEDIGNSMLGVNVVSLIAHAYRAIKQLADKLEAQTA